jgi:hypothetical protein
VPLAQVWDHFQIFKRYNFSKNSIMKNPTSRLSKTQLCKKLNNEIKMFTQMSLAQMLKIGM